MSAVTNTKPSVEIKDLKSAFKECLESKGKLDDIRASLRSEVYQCLQLALNQKFENDERNEDKKNSNTPPFEIEICHRLIREFLQCSGLVHTLSTFEAEVANVFTEEQRRKAGHHDIMKKFEQQVQKKRDNNSYKESLEIFQNGKRICDLQKKEIPLLLQVVDDIQSKL